MINEAATALNDKERTIKDSKISDTLNNVLNGVIPVHASFETLYNFEFATGTAATSATIASSAIITGGLSAITLPAAGIAAASAGLSNHIVNKQLLHQEKELLYKKSKKLIEELLQEIKEEDVLNIERVNYLRSLLILLQQANKDLKNDLELM